MPHMQSTSKPCGLSHKHTPVRPRAFTSSHSTPGHCLDKFHSLLTNLPASTLDPNNTFSRMIFQKHRTHLSPLQDLPVTSHCSEHETCTLESDLQSSVLSGPGRPDLSCTRLLRSSPPALLSFVWLVACPSCHSDLSYNSLCTLFHPLASLYP